MARRLRSDLRALGSLFLLLMLAGAALLVVPPAWIAEPVSEEPRSMMGSGFVNDHPDVAPWTWWWSDRIALRVDHPEETNIVIWNHHTEAMDGPPSCLGSTYFPPPGIIQLERIGRTRVFYLCSKVGQEGRSQLEYATARRDEVLALVRRFRALGVPSGRIFVAGQSGGSCASLFALGAGAAEMNAGMIFAPACSGPGEGRRRMWGTADAEQRRTEAAMAEAERITALVVAFPQDQWNKPGDLGFLTKAYPTIRLFSPDCAAGHSGAFWGCGVEAVTAEVRKYFLDRLAAAGYPVGPTD